MKIDPLQQSIKIDSNPIPVSNNEKDTLEVIGQRVETKETHRKSIFTDQAGVLIAQVKDHTGEVIVTCPSPEVIKRYHDILKEES